MKQVNAPIATYLYCIVHSDTSPSATRIPAGLPGTGRTRLVEGPASLWLVASDAPVALYGREPIEAGLRDLDWVARCALAHEQVVEHFGRKATVIPMKLFTLFANDQRAAAHIRKIHPKLRRILEGVQGCQEWGVRIRWDGARGGSRSSAGSATGTQFLLARKQQQDRERLIRHRAVDDADTAYRSLARNGKAARRLAIAPADGGGTVILDAAFLVSRSGLKRFRAAVQQIVKRFTGEYKVVLSGPWPPYNFVTGLR